MKKQNMNDKGFSLVELIIVIAIMAILIVVLAPQYLKYVERSRNSTDMQNARTMMTAIETYAADPQAATPFAGGDKFTLTVTNASVTVGGAASGKASAALSDAALIAAGATTSTDIKCSSRTRWSQYEIQGEILSNGSVDWKFVSTPANAFENAMKGNS